MHTYGILKQTETSPAQVIVEPLTLTEVKTFLRLPDLSPADTEQDTLLGAMISGARLAAEWYQGMEIARKQLDLTLDTFYFSGRQAANQWAANQWGIFPVEIPLRRPLISVDLVTCKDSSGVTHTLTENTDYIVDTARGLIMPPFGKCWPAFVPWPSSAVLVRFTAGDGALNPMVAAGMKLLVSHWFAGRLPFELTQTGRSVGIGEPEDYPFGVTALLSYGALEGVY